MYRQSSPVDPHGSCAFLSLASGRDRRDRGAGVRPRDRPTCAAPRLMRSAPVGTFANLAPSSSSRVDSSMSCLWLAGRSCGWKQTCCLRNTG